MTTNTSKFDNDVLSDLPVPPGYYIREMLGERDLSQAELARRMGRPAQVINEIANGKKAITAETALQLEATLGLSAKSWLGLEADYRLTLARSVALRRSEPDILLRVWTEEWVNNATWPEAVVDFLNRAHALSTPDAPVNRLIADMALRLEALSANEIAAKAQTLGVTRWALTDFLYFAGLTKQHWNTAV